MATPMISENWANIIEPGLTETFFENMDATVGDDIMTLYNVQTSDQATEDTLGVIGFGDVPKYQGAIEYDSAQEGYKKTFTHTEMALGFIIQRSLYDDGKYGVMNNMAAQLGLAFGRTRRKDASSVFNNAFSSSYLQSDGDPLCSTSHPTSPTDNTSKSNSGTSALTKANLETARQNMLAFTDARGEKLNVMPDTILVPVALHETAWEIVNSVLDPTNANNTRNMQSSLGYSIIVDEYLTDANNWFLIDSRMARMHLWWWDRVSTEFASDPTADYNLQARYRGYMRYSYGPDSWYWIYGNNVT